MKFNNKQMLSSVFYLLSKSSLSLDFYKPSMIYTLRQLLLSRVAYLCCLAFFVLCSPSIHAQGWAFKVDGFGFGKGSNVIVDGSGNVYAVGVFTLSIDCDPGSGRASLSSNSYNFV